MPTFPLAAALAVVFALLFIISRKLDGIPRAAWSLAKKEREAEVPKALDAMKEAVASRVGGSVVAIQRYEESIAESFRAQIAEAEMRARMSERRAADTATALQAATALVRELREALDAARALPAPTRAGSLPSVVVEEEELDEDEKTRVGKRPCIPPPSGRGASGGAS
jgi:hypothetical protein